MGGWFRWNSGHFIAFLFTRADKGRGWCREHKNDSKRSTIGTSKNKNWKVESPIISSVLGGAGYTEKTVKGQTSNTWTSDSKTENKDVSVKLLVSIGLVHCPVHIVARVAEGQRCRNFGIAVPKEWTFNLFCWDWKERIHQRYIKYKILLIHLYVPKEWAFNLCSWDRKEKETPDRHQNFNFVNWSRFVSAYNFKTNIGENLLRPQVKYVRKFGRWILQQAISLPQVKLKVWDISHFVMILFLQHQNCLALIHLCSSISLFPFWSDKGRQYFPKFYAPFINICLYSLL